MWHALSIHILSSIELIDICLYLYACIYIPSLCVPHRLWHQLTKELLGLIEDSSFQQGTVLVDLYQKFVSTFADSIQPLGLVRIARAASRRLGERWVILRVCVLCGV